MMTFCDELHLIANKFSITEILIKKQKKKNVMDDFRFGTQQT